MIAKFYINTEQQKSLIDKYGWKTMTVCRLLHKIGLSTKDIQNKKVKKGLLGKRYAWKTEDQLDIINRGLIQWWLQSNDLSVYAYIPDNSNELELDKKYRLDYFKLDNVTMRLIRSLVFRGDETSFSHLPFSRL